jgi:hypothetical protein
MILGNKKKLFAEYLSLIFRGSPNDGNITRNDHDLVLLKLQNRARYTDRVKPIRLPNLKNEKLASENIEQCIVSGFGTIKDTRQSHILKYLTVPIVGRNQWYIIYSNFIIELFFL